MTSVIRLFTLAATTAVTVLAAGCASQGAARSSVPPASHSASASADHPVAGADVYLAEGQDVRGTTAHAPGCQAGCPLSGDGTTVLWDMTWPTWAGGQAVGTGTEKIDGCDPNCAAGPEYSVA
jgi:hypothetical protein